MCIATTQGADFVKPFIGNGYFQRLRLIGKRDEQTTPERLSDVNVKADSSIFALGPIEGNIINSNELSHMLE